MTKCKVCGRSDFETEHMTLHELSERNFTRAVIVFKDESYDKPYPFASRAYEVSGASNYFNPDKISKALYGSSLDGTDVGVRLDKYLENWVVDYCFIIE